MIAMKTHSNTRTKHVLTLCACLALSSPGMTSAQSTDVTLFGLVDISMVHASGNTAKRTGLMDGTYYGPGSRWGLRVQEDLGAGVRVGAWLESGFLADTGAGSQGGRLFGRQSFLWIKSEQFGELRLGRQYVLHDQTLAAINPTGNTTVMSPAGLYTTDTGTIQPMLSSRADNAIQVFSPRFYGLQAQLMYAFRGPTQDHIYRGVRLNYTRGPLTVVAAHEHGSARDVPAGGKPAINRITVFGGSYDFDVVKLFAGYERAKDLAPGMGTGAGTLLPGLNGAATQLQAFTVGASIPAGDLTYALNYVHSRFGAAAGGRASIGRYGAAATWQLSKSTAVYSAFALAAGDLKSIVYEKRIIQFGLRQRF